MNNCPFLINLQSVKFIFTTLHFKNNEKFKKNGNSNIIRVVRKLKMWYNLSARYERRKLESSLYGVTLIHI